MRKLLIVVAGLLLGVATTASAQERGTFDLGAFARYTMPDSHLGLENAFGGGARLGVFIANNIAIEGQYSYATAALKDNSGDATIVPLYARLALHGGELSDSWRGIIAGGWVRDMVEQPNGTLRRDDGVSALLGLQRRMGDRTSLRLDVIGDMYRTCAFVSSGLARVDVSAQLGLNLRFGHLGPKDSDKDGVADAMDACPNTPIGELVDARGCVPPKDADRDGVIDANDRCANTPAGTRVDASGCAVPVDSDRDGVMDNVDACANTPAGTRVDARGCPLPPPAPVDTDRDGVTDDVDACANTAAGVRVDARGCPVPVDLDMDGVMDNVDACPNTARGVRVDARGCAIVFEEGRRNLVLEGVNFATGSAVLSAESRGVLDRVAASLMDATDVRVEVAGHTDNTGSRAINVRLSGQRAESVRAYLVSKGVAATRLSAKGYGPDEPTATNDSADGRLQNRRVELKRMN